MKTLTIATALLFLSGCKWTDNRAEELKFVAMPMELADCRVFFVRDTSAGSMTVARCPNSTTTTSVQMGKVKAVAIVVDGVEYVPSQK